jgi:hypothetical protein
MSFPASAVDSQSAAAAVDATRFATVMPATEITVRTCLDDDLFDFSQYIKTTSNVFELVHCRSEQKGRPEMNYMLSTRLLALPFTVYCFYNSNSFNESRNIIYCSQRLTFFN